MAGDGAEEVRRFAPRGFASGAKALAALFSLFLIWTAVVGAGPEPQLLDHVGPALLAPLFAAPFWRASRMRLETSDEGVRVVGFVSDHFARWEDIEEIALDYFGLHVIGRDGTRLTAAMLGQARWRKWRGRRGRNDEIADHLRARLQAHGHPSQ
jgi:hypothetical protein